DNNSANPLSYLTLFAYVMPWTIFFVIGLIESTLAATRRRENQGAVLALLLVALPVVVMSFFPDRKERYLLPLLAPAAILASIGVRQVMRSEARWAWIAHGIVLLAIAIGLPLTGTISLKTVNGQPWYSGTFAMITI